MLDKKDLQQCKEELETLIDTHKNQTKDVVQTVKVTKEQYRLWWAELEEVRELLK